MSDVTIPSQDETMNALSRFGEVFDRARNAIIDASNLAKEVAELRQQVEEVKVRLQEADAQHVLNLETITHLRNELQTAQEASSSWQSKHDVLNSDYSALVGQHSSLQEQYNATAEKLNTTVRERDDAQLEVMRLTEKVEQMEHRHKQFQDAVETLWKSIMPQPRNEDGQFAEFPKVASGSF